MLKQTTKPPHHSFPPGQSGHSPAFTAPKGHAPSPHPRKQGGSGLPQSWLAFLPRQRFSVWLQSKKGGKSVSFWKLRLNVALLKGGV